MKAEVRKVIDGKTFVITEMSPRRAFPVYTWLMSLIGKTAGGAAGAIKNFKDVKGLEDLFNNANVDLGKLANSLAQSIQSIDDNPKVEAHVDALLSCAVCDGAECSLDSVVFQGKMILVTKVVVESMKVNFSDFFEGSGGVGGIMSKAMTSQDTMSDTQTSEMKTG